MTKRANNHHEWAAAALAFWLPRWYMAAAKEIEKQAVAQAAELRRLAR